MPWSPSSSSSPPRWENAAARNASQVPSTYTVLRKAFAAISRPAPSPGRRGGRTDDAGVVVVDGQASVVLRRRDLAGLDVDRAGKDLLPVVGVGGAGRPRVDEARGEVELWTRSTASASITIAPA